MSDLMTGADKETNKKKIQLLKVTIFLQLLTLKAPIMTAADDRFSQIFSNFQKE